MAAKRPGNKKSIEPHETAGNNFRRKSTGAAICEAAIFLPQLPERGMQTSDRPLPYRRKILQDSGTGPRPDLVNQGGSTGAEDQLANLSSLPRFRTGVNPHTSACW